MYRVKVRSIPRALTREGARRNPWDVMPKQKPRNANAAPAGNRYHSNTDNHTLKMLQKSTTVQRITAVERCWTVLVNTPNHRNLQRPSQQRKNILSAQI